MVGGCATYSGKASLAPAFSSSSSCPCPCACPCDCVGCTGGGGLDSEIIWASSEMSVIIKRGEGRMTDWGGEHSIKKEVRFSEVNKLEWERGRYLLDIEYEGMGMDWNQNCK